MHLTIQKKNFLRSLARTHSVADRKSSMPILSNILLSAENPKVLRCAATDLYLSVNSNSPAEIKNAGTIALAARTLFEIVKSLPEGELSLQVGTNHSAEIRSGKVRFKIPGMPGADFPALPSAGPAEFAQLDADELGRLITLTHYTRVRGARPNSPEAVSCRTGLKLIAAYAGRDDATLRSATQQNAASTPHRLRLSRPLRDRVL